MLEQFRERGIRLPVVLHSAGFDPRLAVDPMVFAATNRVDDVVHYVIDLMERARIATDASRPGAGVLPHRSRDLDSWSTRRYFGGSATFAARRTNRAVVPLVWLVPPERTRGTTRRADQGSRRALGGSEISVLRRTDVISRVWSASCRRLAPSTFCHAPVSGSHHRWSAGTVGTRLPRRSGSRRDLVHQEGGADLQLLRWWDDGLFEVNGSYVDNPKPRSSGRSEWAWNSFPVMRLVDCSLITMSAMSGSRQPPRSGCKVPWSAPASDPEQPRVSSPTTSAKGW